MDYNGRSGGSPEVLAENLTSDSFADLGQLFLNNPSTGGMCALITELSKGEFGN
jgi:hypothetical protein